MTKFAKIAKNPEVDSSPTSFGYKKRGGGWPFRHFIFPPPLLKL